MFPFTVIKVKNNNPIKSYNYRGRQNFGESFCESLTNFLS